MIVQKLPDFKGGFIYKSIENGRILTFDLKGNILNEKPVNMIRKGLHSKYGTVLDYSNNNVYLKKSTGESVRADRFLFNEYLLKSRKYSFRKSQPADISGSFEVDLIGRIQVDNQPDEVRFVLTEPDTIKITGDGYLLSKSICDKEFTVEVGKRFLKSPIVKSIEARAIENEGAVKLLFKAGSSAKIFNINPPKMQGTPTETKPAGTGNAWNVKGGQKPGHKYIERKPSPTNPDKYIYLYELPSGRREWRDDAGEAVENTPEEYTLDFKLGEIVDYNGETGKIIKESDNYYAIQFGKEVRAINKQEHLKQVAAHKLFKEGETIDYDKGKGQILRIADNLALVKKLSDNSLNLIKLEREMYRTGKGQSEEPEEEPTEHSEDEAYQQFQQAGDAIGLGHGDLARQKHIKVGNEIHTVRWTYDDIRREIDYFIDGKKDYGIKLFGDKYFVRDINDKGLSLQNAETGETGIFISHQDYDNAAEKPGQEPEEHFEREKTYWGDEIIKDKKKTFHFKPEYSADQLERFDRSKKYNSRWGRKTQQPIQTEEEIARLTAEQEKVSKEVAARNKSALESTLFKTGKGHFEDAGFKQQSNPFIFKKNVNIEGNKFDFRGEFSPKEDRWINSLDGDFKEVEVDGKSYEILDISEPVDRGGLIKEQAEISKKLGAEDNAILTEAEINRLVGDQDKNTPEENKLLQRLSEIKEQLKTDGSGIVTYGDGEQISIDELKKMNGKRIFSPMKESEGVSSKHGKQKIYFSDGDVVDGYYEVVEADKVIASHNIKGEVNSKYKIGDAQNRDRSTPQSIAQMAKISLKPNFDFVSDDRTAQNGAPIVNENYNVIAGNGRAIGLQDHYSNGAEQYKKDLIANAERLGFSPEAIEKMNKPLLVRRVAVDDSEAQRLGAISNQDNKLALEERETAKGMATRIDDKTFNKVADLFGNAKGNFTSISDYLDEVGPTLVKELIRSNIIPQNEQHLYFDVNTGRLNASHKSRVKDLLSQSILGDASQHYERIPASAQEGFTKALGDIFSLKGKEGDLSPQITGAVKILARYEAVKDNFKSPDDFISQAANDAFEPLQADGKTLALFDLLSSGRPNQVKDKIREYKLNMEGDMFGGGQSPDEAFDQTFTPKYPKGINKSRLALVAVKGKGILLKAIDTAKNVLIPSKKNPLVNRWQRTSQAQQQPKKQIETEEFKKWFGDSKAIDEYGNPLVLYHGTKRDLEGDFFDESKLGTYTTATSAKLGFFFTDSPAVAETYPVRGDMANYRMNLPLVASSSIESILDEITELQTIVPEVFFDKEEGGYDWEIARLDNFGSEWKYNSGYIFDTKEEALKDAEAEIQNDIKRAYKRLEEAEKRFEDYKLQYSQGANILPVYLKLENPLIYDFDGGDYRDQSFTGLLEEAKEEGNDGVIMLNVYDSRLDSIISNVFVAFNSNQIKSAISNSGEFSTTDNRITKAIDVNQLTLFPSEKNPTVKRWQRLGQKNFNQNVENKDAVEEVPPMPRKHGDIAAWNLKYILKTPKSDWYALPITGYQTTENNKNEQEEMPVFDFNIIKDYKDAPSRFKNNSSDNMTCELCGHDIKRVYWVYNPTKKWTMIVGSECITSFNEGGKSGKDFERDKKLEIARELEKKIHEFKNEYRQLGLKSHYQYGRLVKTPRSRTLKAIIQKLEKIDPRSEIALKQWKEDPKQVEANLLTFHSRYKGDIDRLINIGRLEYGKGEPIKVEDYHINAEYNSIKIEKAIGYEDVFQIVWYNKKGQRSYAGEYFTATDIDRRFTNWREDKRQSEPDKQPAEAQIYTENFKKWFGDWESDPANASKVVGEDGKPLIVYHGTDYDFSEFKPGQEGGIFFTPMPEIAGIYADSRISLALNNSNSEHGSVPNVMPVFLNIKNPLVIDFEGEEDFTHYEEVEEAKEKGHDGVILLNVFDINDGTNKFQKGQNQYIVFDSKQIKSAIGNNGEFDAASESIIKSVDQTKLALMPSKANPKVRRWQRLSEKETPQQVIKDRATVQKKTAQLVDEMQLELGFEKSDTYVTADGEIIRHKTQKEITNPSFRKLKEGEISQIERRYRAYKYLQFYSRKEKVESSSDVAYIFRSLENEAVEHTFALHETEDGKIIVQQLTQGTINASLMYVNMLRDSASRFKTKRIWFIHNHPSGNLVPSNEDKTVFRHIREMFEPEKIEARALIINARSGKYLEIGKENYAPDIEGGKNYKQLKAVSFTRQVFKDVNMPDIKISHPDDIASFLTETRFAVGEKFHLISASTANRINGYFIMTSPIKDTNKFVREMQLLLERSAGVSAFLVGNRFDKNMIELINKAKERLKEGTNEQLFDYIAVETDPNNYKSAATEGMLKGIDTKQLTLQFSKKNPLVKRWQRNDINNKNIRDNMDAKDFAELKHKGKEYNGDTYFSGHILPVVRVALELAGEANITGKDVKKIEQAAYMHDILEDTYTKPEEIEQLFGEETAEVVKLLSDKIKVDGHSKTLEEYYKGIAGSKIASIVKAADRIVNILKLKIVADPKRREKLTNRYKDEMKYYEKYNIYPETIKKTFEK